MKVASTQKANEAKYAHKTSRSFFRKNSLFLFTRFLPFINKVYRYSSKKSIAWQICKCIQKRRDLSQLGLPIAPVTYKSFDYIKYIMMQIFFVSQYFSILIIADSLYFSSTNLFRLNNIEVEKSFNLTTELIKS